MKQRMLSKGLAVAVIILFLGLAVQPSIAITKDGNNNPPDKPDIIGPLRGKPGVEYDYIFVTTDPDEDDVSFYIDWGDGTTTGWTDYVPSESMVTLYHSWDRIDAYPIRVKAKDIYGAEGEWSDLIVEISVEPKDYLFQTIIDIANNPEVKNLLEQYDNDLFKVDIDRSVYRKLLLRNPRLFFNSLFTKPSMSIEYLDKCYNKGIEVTNILGEDKALEIIENIEVTDTKLFDNLNNIISNDEELTNRLEILQEMNKVLDYDDNPIICGISVTVLVGSILLLFILLPISYPYTIITDLIDMPIIESILFLMYLPLTIVFMSIALIGLISLGIASEFDCIDWGP